MIIRERPGLPQLLFAVRGSILPLIAPALLVLVAASLVFVAVDHWVVKLPDVPATPFSVLGVAISLFLGFRNNAAYDRWWEARKLWGALLVDLRALAREADLFLPKPYTLRLIRLSLAFAHLHRCQLRKIAPDAAALAWIDPASGITSSGQALDALNAVLAEARRDGQLDGFGARTLSTRLGTMELNNAGGERIAATPLPYVYSLLIFRTVYLYCLLIPANPDRDRRLDNAAVRRPDRLCLSGSGRGDRGSGPSLRRHFERPAAGFDLPGHGNQPRPASGYNAAQTLGAGGFLPELRAGQLWPPLFP
jgi:putative membrane protein